jgi:hypothetical protein
MMCADVYNKNRVAGGPQHDTLGCLMGVEPTTSTCGFKAFADTCKSCIGWDVDRLLMFQNNLDGSSMTDAVVLLLRFNYITDFERVF